VGLAGWAVEGLDVRGEAHEIDAASFPGGLWLHVDHIDRNVLRSD
jgi:hypothetical protein